MLNWRKSSFSKSGEGDCVEIAHDHPSVLIRDSKNPSGPVLGVPVTRWSAFLSDVQRPS
jgi:Domain of unknown function (DUF397)